MSIQPVSPPLNSDVGKVSSPKSSINGIHKTNPKASEISASSFASRSDSSSEREKDPKAYSLPYPTQGDVTSILERTSSLMTPPKNKKLISFHSPSSSVNAFSSHLEAESTLKKNQSLHVEFGEDHSQNSIFGEENGKNSPLKIKQSRRHRVSSASRRVFKRLGLGRKQRSLEIENKSTIAEPSSPESLFTSPVRKKMRGEENKMSPEKDINLSPVGKFSNYDSFISPLKTKNSKDYLEITPPKKIILSSDTLKRTESFLPCPTPNRKRIHKQDNVFVGSLPHAKDATFSEIEKNKFFDPQHVYLLDGTPHNLVRQAASKSCGAAALLMLYTDIVRKEGLSFSLTADFWNWYIECNLTNRVQLVEATNYTNLKEAQLKLIFQKLELDKKENVLTIEQHISESNMPVIISITHPTIEGHWIIVDAIKGEEVYIRDPFTGTAYKIPRENLENYVAERIEFVLYLTKTK